MAKKQHGKIGIIQIDGKLPNLALMKVASFYKQKGYIVEKYAGPLFHDEYEKVYASKIFKFTELLTFHNSIYTICYA